MPLYRGSGGAGDASTDAYASQISQYAQTAITKANEAAISAAEAAADLVLTNADVVLTNADVVLTHADVVLTNADVVSTALDVIATNANAVATALDVVATNADAASTALDVIATNADAVATALDVVATNADVVATALSETNAASSASTATTQASNASTSAINAALSETNSSTFAANSLTYAGDSAAARDQSQAARDTANLHKLAAEAAATSATNTAAALTGFDLEAIAATKAVTAVDVFVYDTSLDSDGGAWRKRTQGTSWYNETLNTATRGSRKEFPAVAVIVAETNKVTIYDGDDPALPMWMVFNGSGANALYVSANQLKAISAVNGVIAFAGQTLSGASTITFVEDVVRSFGTLSLRTYRGGISQRNASLGHSTSPVMKIVSDACNDVAMTVLPDAPIDPATGLPVPTIRVGTAGGMSVIENDGTVTSTASTVYTQSTSNSPDYDLWHRHDFGQSLLAGGSIYAYMGSSWYLALRDNASNYLEQWAVGDTSEGAPVANKLTQIAFDPTVAKQHLSCGMTATYCSGWMPALVKGAFLADTDDTDLVASGELVTNGTFDTDTTGWTASTANVSGAVVGGQLEVTNNGAGWFYQEITTVVGQRYKVVFDFVAKQSGGRFFIGTSIGSPSLGGSAFAGNGQTIDFVATTTTTYISLGDSAGATGVVNTYDNISVQLADADRSVNNKGLIVNGTVTRTPVATGAELVAYSGFSASNYLEQPYNSDLDFGTGDFSIMGWVKQPDMAGASGGILLRETTFNAGSGFGFYFTEGQFAAMFGGAASLTDGKSYDDGTWRHLVLLRLSGQAYLYVNGSQVWTAARVGSVTDATATTRLGIRHDGQPLTTGSLALWRISATAPTASQIEKIYNDEKFLFQTNAACTIYGASDTVTALAHDPVTDLLHVGTSAGRSVFSGLRRVSNTTTAVGTAISAANNLIVEE